MALLAICFTCSTFIFCVLQFRGVLAPFTHSRGSKDAKQEDRNGRAGASRSQWAARVSDARFLAARSVLVETGGEQSRVVRRKFLCGQDKRAVDLIEFSMNTESSEED
jgi:hypothetical protein